MIKSIWNRITGDKLRAMADKIDPPTPSLPVCITRRDKDDLTAIDDLGPVRGVMTTFDQNGRNFFGVLGSFVLPKDRDETLRDKGLITRDGAITLKGHAALQGDLDTDGTLWLGQDEAA